MCGIVGGVAQRDIAEILLEGLRRLEYRGYDSAGMVTIDNSQLLRLRAQGKVEQLAQALAQQPLAGSIGIAHTRWATHGEPCERNAHPHLSNASVAVVHNGIVENFTEMRDSLQANGYEFVSDTDTEIIAHQFHQNVKQCDDLLQAAQQMAQQLQGAFALGLLHNSQPDCLLAIRQGSPLVIGLGIGENFIASDYLALLPVAQRFIYLQEGDIAQVYKDKVVIYDVKGKIVERPIKNHQQQHDIAERGEYRHFMLKEIFEQPDVVQATLSSRLSDHRVLDACFGPDAAVIFVQIKRVHIVACGTSYHAGMVGRYWLERLAKLPCRVEIASEFRYRQPVVEAGTLFLTLSQSGETADTLAALREAQRLGFLATLAICNVAESTLVREASLNFITHAGPEMGVASTKAFTTQLSALLLLTLALGRSHCDEAEIVSQLKGLPQDLQQALALNNQIKQLAQRFADKQHALFLGRGEHYPIALEGALKLKEISYIHAEAYPAGELKHGPLALVDKSMPVVAIAPNDALLEKLKSNLQEVRARGGELIVFAAKDSNITSEEGMTVIELSAVASVISPIVYTLPLQLLAYHVAVIKGTDVDQPRNLAKSVTVE